MLFLFSLCLLSLFCENDALKDTLKKKNLDFVENLKHDLQRNNDDYVEKKQNMSQTNNTLQSLDQAIFNSVRYKILTTRDVNSVTKSDHSSNKVNLATLKTTHSGTSNRDKDVRIKIIDNIRRRVDDALVSKELINNRDPQRMSIVFKGSNKTEKPPMNDHPKLLSIWSQMQNFMKEDSAYRHRFELFPSKYFASSHMSTSSITPTTNLQTTKTLKKKKHRKKHKMETLKKFIHKNKGLLKEFISSKKQAARMNRVTPATPNPSKQKQPKMFSANQLNNVMRKAVNRLNHKKSLEELPNAAVLDMFPAKGGRIHSKRVRGHLCHRHVLIPEGPKYNSLGHIYLLPHAAAHVAHEYNATDVPKLLLPRCCNCCRKSVLGCQ